MIISYRKPAAERNQQIDKKVEIFKFNPPRLKAESFFGSDDSAQKTEVRRQMTDEILQEETVYPSLFSVFCPLFSDF
jgi:hypothetical protein